MLAALTTQLFLHKLNAIVKYVTAINSLMFHRFDLVNSFMNGNSKLFLLADFNRDQNNQVD